MAKVVPSGVIQLPDFAQLEYDLNRQKRADELETAKTLSQFRQREGVIAPGSMPFVQSKLDGWQDAMKNFAKEQTAENYTALSNAYDQYAQAHGAGKYLLDEGRRLRSEYYSNPTKYAITSSDLESQISNLIQTRYQGPEDLYAATSSIIELPVGVRPTKGDPESFSQRMIDDWDVAKDQYADRNGRISEDKAIEWANSYIQSNLQDPAFSKYAAAVQGLDSRLIGVAGQLRDLEEIDRMSPEQMGEYLNSWSERVKTLSIPAMSLNAFGTLEREKLGIQRAQLSISRDGAGRATPDSLYASRAPRWDDEKQIAVIDIPGIKAVVGDQTVIKAGIDSQKNLKVLIQQKDPKDPEGPVQERWIDASDDLWQSIGQSIDSDVKISGFWNELVDGADELASKYGKKPEAAGLPVENAPVSIGFVEEQFKKDREILNRARGIAESNPKEAGRLLRQVAESPEGGDTYANIIKELINSKGGSTSYAQEDVDFVLTRVKEAQNKKLQELRATEKQQESEKSQKEKSESKTSAAGELSVYAGDVGEIIGSDFKQGESIAEYVSRLKSEVEAARKNVSSISRTPEQKARLDEDKRIVKAIGSNINSTKYRKMLRLLQDYQDTL
jgi:hypothetical protein